MPSQLLPKSFDNRFGGHALALWLLAGLIAFKLLVSVNSIVNTESVAVGADGYALESFGPGGPIVLMLFASMSVGRLMLALIAITALVRYRAMVPFIYLIFLIDYAARRIIASQYDIERARDADSFVFYLNVAMLVVLVFGFILSLWRKRRTLATATIDADRP